MAKKGIRNGWRVHYVIYDEVANWPEDNTQDIVLSEMRELMIELMPHQKET